MYQTYNVSLQPENYSILWNKQKQLDINLKNELIPKLEGNRQDKAKPQYKYKYII